MKATKIKTFSVQEYIEQEQTTDIRHEYHDGYVVALAGGTINHGLICGNIYAELRANLKKKSGSCTPINSEVKLYIKNKNSYVYPDAMVVCGDLETAEEDKNAVTNPVVVVEVLSKSTGTYDRGDKFHLYRQLPSLKEYVLIEQEKAVVEVYYKYKNSDLWKITRYEGLNEIVDFQAIEVEVPMQALYENIDFQ
jgi:Uma2 family endonuclease